MSFRKINQYEEPEKYTWSEFLVKPITRRITNAWKSFKERFLGYWYCHECNKLHSPRVKKFYITIMFNLGQRSVCSLHSYKTLTNKEDKHEE